MKSALLIIDVQKAVRPASTIVSKIEALQNRYKAVFASKFVNRGSFLLKIMNWKGYDDDALAFTPAPHTVVFEKNVYSSYINAFSAFDEVHLCGYDTDACVYKTALDLIEHGIRPVVLSHLCGSENEHFHQIGLDLLRRNVGVGNVL